MAKLTRTRAWDDAWNLTQPVHQLGFQIDRTPAQQEVCDEMEALVQLPLPIDAIYHAAAAVRAAWQVGRASVSPEKAVDLPKRPENFEFAMDFLGDPEAAALRQYIEALERAAGVVDTSNNQQGQARGTQDLAAPHGAERGADRTEHRRADRVSALTTHEPCAGQRCEREERGGRRCFGDDCGLKRAARLKGGQDGAA